MRTALLVALSLASALGGAASLDAQGLLGKSAVQYAAIVATASAAEVPAGSVVTLWADVTPKASIHIYAEGAKDFTPVSLVLTPNPGITAGKPKYPKPDVATAPGSTDAVPAYKQPFRIALPVTIRSTSKKGDVVTIAGAVRYQACDDRLCYPVTAAPISWTVSVK